MPFYEYECSHCRYYSEVLQKITDKPLKKCPSCGKSTFKKLISAPVFRLKGSGWYETDFKGDNDHKRNLAGSDKDDGPGSAASDAKAESKADGKTDSKTDSKTESKSEGEGKADAKPADGKAVGSKGADSKADAKAGGKAKTPPVTSRTVAGRGTRAKSSASRRPAPAKRKASKRRGGR